MDIQKINQYKTKFDSIVNNIIGNDGSVIEVWYVRWVYHMVEITKARQSIKMH